MAQKTEAGLLIGYKYCSEITRLPDEDLAALIRALCTFRLTGEREDESLGLAASMMFNLISDEVADNVENYDRRCKQNSDNAKKRPLANENDGERSLANENDCERSLANENDGERSLANENDCERPQAIASERKRTKTIENDRKRSLANENDGKRSQAIASERKRTKTIASDRRGIEENRIEENRIEGDRREENVPPPTPQGGSGAHAPVHAREEESPLPESESSPVAVPAPETQSAPEPQSAPASKPKRAKPFVKPTVEEVRAYAAERGQTAFDAAHFVDYYEANGWKVGKNKMHDWQAAVRTWIRRDEQSGTATCAQNRASPQTGAMTNGRYTGPPVHTDWDAEVAAGRTEVPDDVLRYLGIPPDGG